MSSSPRDNNIDTQCICRGIRPSTRRVIYGVVQQCAIDPGHASNLAALRQGSPELDKFEEHRINQRYELAETPQESDEWPQFNDHPYMPWVYATVQDALLAFLAELVMTDRFPYTYEMWLRTIILIVADAQMEPKWLRVIAQAQPPDDLDNWCRTEHVMTISDDWSCLSHETFDFVLRTYAGQATRSREDA